MPLTGGDFNQDFNDDFLIGLQTYNVRIWGFRGLTQMPISLPKHIFDRTRKRLVHPQEFGQVLAIQMSGPAVSSSADPGNQTAVLFVDVPDGQQIRYEINPPGRGAIAGNASPSLSGRDLFSFSPGWTISIIDINSVP